MISFVSDVTTLGVEEWLVEAREPKKRGSGLVVQQNEQIFPKQKLNLWYRGWFVLRQDVHFQECSEIRPETDGKVVNLMFFEITFSP